MPSTRSGYSAREELLDVWTELAQRFSANWFGAGQAALFAEIEAALPTLSSLRAGATASEALVLIRVMSELWPYLTREGLGRELEEWLAAHLAEAGDLVDANTAVRANWVRAWLAFDTMTFDRVESIFQALESAAVDAEHHAAHAQLLGIRALYEGDPRAARQQLLAAYARHRTEGPASARFIDLSFLAASVSALGNHNSAYDYCELTIALCDEHGEHLMRSYVIWAFALSAWRADDHHRAYVLALDGVRNAVGVGDNHAAAMCIDIAAWYASHCGQPWESARLLGSAEALRLTNRLPAPHLGTELAHRRCVDEVLTQIGSVEFRRVFAETRRTTLGDVGVWLAESSALAADSAMAPRLTPRQHEIASLIAEGLTNKEISRRLLITVSTVETHIEHVFRKLDVVSRAQVAAWAASQLRTARR